MIHVLTDFGSQGPYQGELLSVLARLAPDVTAIDLMSDLPRFNPRASAYLLSAISARFEVGDGVLAVVDPDVGTDRREPVWCEADGRFYVGPHNGLFNIVMRRAKTCHIHRIDWRPADLSNSFHGRDLFAPLAAKLARGEIPASSELDWRDPGADRWPQDLAEIVYIDAYGNAMTGLRASVVSPHTSLSINGSICTRSESFGLVSRGEPLCYANAYGLLEVAVNQGNAAHAMNLGIGSPVQMVV